MRSHAGIRAGMPRCSRSNLTSVPGWFVTIHQPHPPHNTALNRRLANTDQANSRRRLARRHQCIPKLPPERRLAAGLAPEPASGQPGTSQAGCKPALRNSLGLIRRQLRDAPRWRRAGEGRLTRHGFVSKLMPTFAKTIMVRQLAAWPADLRSLRVVALDFGFRGGFGWGGAGYWE